MGGKNQNDNYMVTRCHGVAVAKNDAARVAVGFLSSRCIVGQYRGIFGLRVAVLAQPQGGTIQDNT
jgi:hypothetical protein